MEQLKELKQKYPNIKIEENDGKINIFNLWNDDSFFLRFDKNVKLNFLNNLFFPPELVAIYSLKDNFIEVFAFPAQPELELIHRKFTFNYKGNSYECFFDSPSKDFVKIAKGFREYKEESRTSYRNLRQFRDFYRIKELPGFIAKYFEGKKPYNFFIKGPIDKIHSEIIDFAKLLNFYMLFFDRETPTLLIFNKQYDKEKFVKPCYLNNNDFPKIINASKIDDILLEIVTVANETSDIRLQFIFYYQILEYASYYYLKSDIKKKLESILKKPDVSYRSDYYSKKIVDNFKNHFKNNDDKAKLEILISDYITLTDIKDEIEENMQYFSKEIKFDGGFRIKPIMNNEISGISQLQEAGTIKQIKENIINIRNSLVHLRESRENKIILPTEKNDNLILPYLYLLRRIAEKIIIENN